MSLSEHPRVFRRVIQEAFNDGRLAILNELLTADFVDHSPCRQIGGPEALRERIVLLRAAMPDLTVRIDDMAASGDMTWAAITVSGAGLRFSQIDTPLRGRPDRRILERVGRCDGAIGHRRRIGGFPFSLDRWLGHRLH